MRKCVLLSAGMLFLAASFAWAGFYRWVDQDGKEFFTNDQAQVPQEYRSTAVLVNPDASRVSVSEKPVAAQAPSRPLKDHKDKYGQGEEQWHKRAVKLRKELAALQDKYDLILQQEKSDEDKPTKISSRTGAKKKKSQAGREKSKSVLERKIARKKHELEVELPEEARKADAYPGWIRE